jgi:VanZ family protein
MKYTFWALWGLFLAAWTAALVTSEPVRIHDQYLHDPWGIPLGKVLHVGAYAFLAATAGLLRLRRPWGWLVLIALLEHGVLTEFAQSFNPDRTPAVFDILLDHAGVALGASAAWAWFTLRKGRGAGAGPRADFDEARAHWSDGRRLDGTEGGVRLGDERDDAILGRSGLQPQPQAEAGDD